MTPARRPSLSRRHAGGLPRAPQFVQTAVEGRLRLGLPEPGIRDALPSLDPFLPFGVAQDDVENDPALGFGLLGPGQITLRVLDLDELLFELGGDQVAPQSVR
jgi:hypothetical protein